MRLRFLKKRGFKIAFIIAAILIIICVYFANNLFMKTTFISDWTNEGTAVYYFKNGMIIAHQIKRQYENGKIEEGKFESTVNRYYILFPVKMKFVDKSKIDRMRKFVFNELDVMNDMDFEGCTDATYTTTFYSNFKSVKYYSQPPKYVQSIIKTLY